MFNGPILNYCDGANCSIIIVQHAVTVTRYAASHLVTGKKGRQAMEGEGDKKKGWKEKRKTIEEDNEQGARERRVDKDEKRSNFGAAWSILCAILAPTGFRRDEQTLE